MLLINIHWLDLVFFPPWHYLSRFTVDVHRVSVRICCWASWTEMRSYSKMWLLPCSLPCLQAKLSIPLQYGAQIRRHEWSLFRWRKQQADKMLPMQVWTHMRGRDGGSGRRNKTKRQERGLRVGLRGSPISSVVMLPVSPSVPPNLIPCPPSISVSFPSSIPLGDRRMIKKKKMLA